MIKYLKLIQTVGLPYLYILVLKVFLEILKKKKTLKMN